MFGSIGGSYGVGSGGGLNFAQQPDVMSMGMNMAQRAGAGRGFGQGPLANLFRALQPGNPGTPMDIMPPGTRGADNPAPRSQFAGTPMGNMMGMLRGMFTNGGNMMPPGAQSNMPTQANLPTPTPPMGGVQRPMRGGKTAADASATNPFQGAMMSLFQNGFSGQVPLDPQGRPIMKDWRQQDTIY
jgi:hypothetical protein